MAQNGEISVSYYKPPQPSVAPSDPRWDIMCKFVSRGLRAVHKALEHEDTQRAQSHIEILREMLKEASHD